jgi:hypothetical protein
MYILPTMLNRSTISIYKYKSGIPNTKTVLLKAEMIGKFNNKAAKMQTKAKR